MARTKKPLNRSVARAVEAAQYLERTGGPGTRFTARDLGVGSYAIARAAGEGYLRVTKKKLKTGKRGRPATLLQLTAKGRKA